MRPGAPGAAAPLGLALALALSACAGPACPKLLITDPAQALATRRYDPGAVRSLRAEARVDQRGREGRIKGRVLMFVERPDQIRFDVMTQFGPALVLTSDGRSFALSDFKAERYLTGGACEQNIARLIGVALSGEAVASVLLGDVPPLEVASERVECSGHGGYVVERRATSGARQRLELAVHEDDFKRPPEAQRSELREVRYWDASGRPLYRVRYEDYRRVGAARLPFTVRIEDLAHDADALLRFQSIDVNVRVPPDAFAQSPRPGLRVEEVSCPESW